MDDLCDLFDQSHSILKKPIFSIFMKIIIWPLLIFIAKCNFVKWFMYRKKAPIWKISKVMSVYTLFDVKFLRNPIVNSVLWVCVEECILDSERINKNIEKLGSKEERRRANAASIPIIGQWGHLGLATALATADKELTDSLPPTHLLPLEISRSACAYYIYLYLILPYFHSHQHSV